MQKSTHEPGRAKQHQFVSDCTQSRPALQSTLPPSYICTNQSWSQQQSMLLERERKRWKFHTCCMFSIEDACTPFWSFYGEITLPMTSWWKGLGCRSRRILSEWEDCHWQGIYYNYHQIDWQVWLCSGYLIETREKEDVQVRPGYRHCRKICRRWESTGVVFAEWPVTGVGGKASSPNTPAGMRASKYAT